MDKLLYTFFNNRLPTIDRGKGIYLFDKKGNKFTDLTGGFTGHALLGWGNKIIINSIKKQLNKITHVDYKYFRDENRSRLANVLLSKNNNKLNKVFFIGSSGAEACEAALKMSFQVHFNNGHKKKKISISRLQSYHGCSSHSIAIGDRPNLEFYKPILNQNVRKVSEHNFLRNKKKDENISEYAMRSANELEKKIISLGPENVANFTAETMSGGLVGDVPPAPGYWRQIRRICNKYNVHLILDEVWCGTGSSGKYFCIDYEKITPDFLFLSKTLGAGYGALSAVVTKNNLFKNVEKKHGQIYYSNTHQGHSISIAAALAVQKIINKKDFLYRVQENGQYLRNLIKGELSNHEFFFNVRGRGLRNSFEYRCKNQNLFGNALKKIMLNKYKILIDSKWHRICFSPALNIKKIEIDKNLELLTKEFKLLARNWSKKKISNIKFKYF